MSEPLVFFAVAVLAAALPAALSVAAGALLAAALGAVVAVVLLSRWRPGGGGERPTTDEVRSILTRIERTLAEQRHQAETERRILAQKLEGVRRAIAHGAGVARSGAGRGPASRDTEAEEVRRQIEAVQGGAAPAAEGAPPPPHDSPDAVADAPAAASQAESFSPPALDISELTPSPTKAKAPDPDGDDAPEGERPEPSAPEADEHVPNAPAAAPASPADVQFAPDAGPSGDGAPPSDEGLFLGSSGLFEPMAFAAPAPPAPPQDDAAWVARPSAPHAAAPEAPAVAPSDAIAYETEGDSIPDDVVIPAEPPEGAEDLTVIQTIDAETQAHLYGSGVLTLDDVARLGKADAQRIERELGVPEQTVMGQWVFEAQAVLFDRFSAQSAI